MRPLLAVVLLVSTLATAGEEYDFGVTGDGLLPPAKKDAYGPGIDSDATGRPFYWSPKNDPQGKRSYPDPTLKVKPDGYGLGVGRDQYGRPMQRRKR